MRMIQTPGFVVTQTADVMMEGHFASELNRMVQASRDVEMERTQVIIGNVAEELVRRTDILGTAIHQIAENAVRNNKKVTEDIQKWGSRSGTT